MHGGAIHDTKMFLNSVKTFNIKTFQVSLSTLRNTHCINFVFSPQYRDVQELLHHALEVDIDDASQHCLQCQIGNSSLEHFDSCNMMESQLFSNGFESLV